MRPWGVKFSRMDTDDISPPPRKDSALAQLLAEDLDRLSLTELDARIAALKAELARTETKRDGAGKFRSAADSLFKKA